MKAVLAAALYPNVAKIIFPELQFKQMISGSIPVTVQPHELRFVLKSGGTVSYFPRTVVVSLTYCLAQRPSTSTPRV